MISTTTGYIDLSKRRVSPEDITKCEERFIKSKTVASIMRYTASKLSSATSAAAIASVKESAEPREEQLPEEDTVGGVAEVGIGSGEEELEALYELIAWPLGDKYGHPYDAFKLALT
jgi:translation initiation factor 2 subunit 1